MSGNTREQISIFLKMSNFCFKKQAIVFWRCWGQWKFFFLNLFIFFMCNPSHVMNLPHTDYNYTTKHLLCDFSHTSSGQVLTVCLSGRDARALCCLNTAYCNSLMQYKNKLTNTKSPADYWSVHFKYLIWNWTQPCLIPHWSSRVLSITVQM